ncbi:MAG: TIGR01777 family oxidoreductase [Planctomycetaceae bacterium]|nr:TIGR01777 family oxidoreductase [Planctomycetaceae bacterium]
MNIFITGASGLLGSRLTKLFEADGHTVTKLTRKSSGKPNERVWDARVQSLSPAVLDGCEVLVHLAGENIGDGRWTEKKKEKIRESRVNGTRILAEAIQGMSSPPQAFICASATGYYGDRGAEILTEKSEPGEGFLPEVCVAWEKAADPARDRTRVVHVRTGVVLSPDGGALAKMLFPFKMGVGGVIGSGNQYMSWITAEDSARLFQYAAMTDQVVGPVNGGTENPVTNREFTKTLGKVLFRPTIFPIPAFGAKMAFGQMAEDLLLASTRAIPEATMDFGFSFRHPTLEEALRSLDL